MHRMDQSGSFAHGEDTHTPRKPQRACQSSGEVCESVITRQPWKFASTQVAKTQKSLVNTDFSGTSETSQKRISKNISKKFNNPMISAKAVSYTEGYRSGHNEAVLKTVCPLDTWVRISHPPPPKSLENTTFSRLFSFYLFPNLSVFCLISCTFPINKKSRKSLLHKAFRDFILEMFLEILVICVVKTNFTSKTERFYTLQ